MSDQSKTRCERVASHPSRPEIVDREQLEKFLATDDDLVELICETLSKAMQEFKASTYFVLAPFADQEEKHESLRFFLVISTSLDLATAYRCLGPLEAWWFEQCHRAGGTLSPAVEYVRQPPFASE
jgi:hypothetical protein